MNDTLTRRTWLAQTGVLAGALAATPAAAAAPDDVPPPDAALRYCLNTSTIRGQKLPLADEVELAAKAGYQAIEPWIGELRDYQQAGGSLDDLRRQIADWGLEVPSAIGFAEWIVDDPARRAAGLEQARRDMELVRAIGGTRIAAPPAGATDVAGLDLRQVAERLAKLLEIGRSLGVTPQLELWGFSKTLSRLSELLFVAAETGRDDVCLLTDVYHIYKGGSQFSALRLVAGRAMPVLHLNDYPAGMPREQISDRHRVYPGDGVAPLGAILKQLHANGFRGILSLELFNPEYWSQDAAQVAATGLEKMKAAVAATFG